MSLRLLAIVVVALGCSSRKPPAAPRDHGGYAAIASVERSKESTPGEAPLLPGEAPLLNEAVRQLSAMKSTRYRHKSKVDEAAGLFEYDCSGFVAYALARSVPNALAAVPIGSKGRPRAEDFAIYFAALAGTDPWVRVAPSAIKPGDVIAWTRPAEVSGTNTGHMGIVFDVRGSLPPATPVAAIGGAREILIRLIDATESPHADDVRGPDTATGLGTGTIGLVVDQSDAPLGYRWKGGSSPKAYATVVAIARPG